MSVLIKGIKMPKCCVDCPCFYDFISCQALFDETDDFSASGFDEYKMRLPNCPLVEVPTPHGHLIDSAELLSAKFAGIYHDPVVSDKVEKTDEEVYAYRVGWNTALDAAYLNAPIVISAEEGADE